MRRMTFLGIFVAALMLALVTWTPCPAAEGPPALAAATAPALAPSVDLVSPLTTAAVGVVRDVVFPSVAGFVVALIGLAARAASKKWGVDVLLRKQQFLEAAALQGLSFAEERAASALKHKGVALAGHDKLELAVAHILDSVPRIPKERARAVVESLLARTPGVGSTGDAALAPVRA